MFDLFGITLTSAIVLFVCIRAIGLDRKLPWFPRVQLPDSELKVAQPWRRPR